MTKSSGSQYSWRARASSLSILLLGLTRHGWASGTAFWYPPASTSCTEASWNSTIWEVKNFNFDSQARLSYGVGTAGKTSLTIKNLVDGYEFSCSTGHGLDVTNPNFSQRDGKVWYNCNTYCFSGDVNPPLDTSFNFDPSTKVLSLNQKWTCAGKTNMTTP